MQANDNTDSTRPLDVAFALHDPRDRYWAYTAVALHSLCLHSTCKLRVHLLHDQTVKPATIAILGELCGRLGHELRPHDIELPSRLQALDTGHFSPATLFRLLIPQLLPDAPLVVYLDSDLVFNGVDVSELVRYLQIHRSSHAIAAVHDDVFTCSAAQVRELQAVGIAADRYFNAGVLVMYPPAIEEDLLDGACRFSAKFPAAFHFDQDFLNITFGDRVLYLPAKFNTHVQIAYGRCFEPLSFFEGKVLHFSGKTKPLSGTLCPPDIFFWRYSLPIGRADGFVPEPIRYLQKIPGTHSSARLVHTNPPTGGS